MIKKKQVGNMKPENNKAKPSHKIVLDKVLKKLGMSGYVFTKDILKTHANYLSPMRKDGYDPKLSTLLRLAKLLNCGIEDLFESPDYEPKNKKQ